MAYSTLALVTSEFKAVSFTATSAVKDIEVEQWIIEADAYIDGRIGLIYSTPVTGTKSLEILKTISIGIVAQRIARVMEVKSTTAKGDQLIPKDLILEAEKKLDMIVNRQLLLSDASFISTTQGVKSYTSSNTVLRAFDQSKAQW